MQNNNSSSAKKYCYLCANKLGKQGSKNYRCSRSNCGLIGKLFCQLCSQPLRHFFHTKHNRKFLSINCCKKCNYSLHFANGIKEYETWDYRSNGVMVVVKNNFIRQRCGGFIFVIGNDKDLTWEYRSGGDIIAVVKNDFVLNSCEINSYKMFNNVSSDAKRIALKFNISFKEFKTYLPML